MATGRRARLRSGFSLGGELAEADSLLEPAFFESGDFSTVDSKTDKRCFLVGRTGAGKSAVLQHLEEVRPEHVIRINPIDLSLPYITDRAVIRYLRTLDVHLDLLWIALWKHVLLVEVLRRKYKVDTPAAKQNVMTSLRDKLRRDPAKMEALDYLDNFAGKFWCETDIRVREITDAFTEKIEAEARIHAGIGGAGVGLDSTGALVASQTTRMQEAEKYQRIVNETQLARLNKMLSVLNEDILDSPQDFTYVVIDDLDKNWVDEGLANDLMRCLFQTVLDLKRVQNLKVVVALRTNLLVHLDFGRSSGQEEKFRALLLQMRWTRADLESLLDERVRVAGGAMGLTATSISELLPPKNATRGNPVDYILDRTLLRPRDAIAFANECLALGGGKTRLSWVDIQTAERAYSANRLLALRDEWKVTYPGIDRVLDVFRRAPARMDRDEFKSRLEDVGLLLAAPDFPGLVWLTQLSEAMWAGGDGRTWFDLYQPLARFLYGLGIVGCSTGARAKPTFYLDDQLLLDSESQVDRLNFFYVHRAYHAALDVRPGNPANE